MKLKISVIVPVYQVEDVLERCVNSLVNQTYRNIEIILVDDGSIDKSPEICDKYSKSDSRITTIHKKNGGLSDARNYGLNIATGDYILFVDSDDYIEENTCEEFLNFIKEKRPDIIAGNAVRIENTKRILMSHNYHGDYMISGKEYLLRELSNNSMYMAAWLNLYKKDFLIKNELVFKKGLLHEDEQFTPRAFLSANEVMGLNMYFYNYIIRNNSITKKNNLINNACHIIETCKEMEKIYNALDEGRLKLLLKDNLATKYLYAFQIGQLYGREYKCIIDKKFLVKNAKSFKNRIKVTLFLINPKIYFYINKLVKCI